MRQPDGCGGRPGRVELMTGIVTHSGEQDPDRHVALPLRRMRFVQHAVFAAAVAGDA
jgi:hypothetical protein